MQIEAWLWQKRKKLRGRAKGKGSPAFQSTNYKGNEVRWHRDLQERKIDIYFVTYFHLETNSPLKKRKRHWPAVWSDRWLCCCRSDPVPDHHAMHSSKPPALWGQTPETQYNIPSVTGRTTVDFNQYDFPFSLDCLALSTLSYSCMLPGHSKCASLMECPDKAPWSYSEWPDLNRNRVHENGKQAHNGLKLNICDCGECFWNRTPNKGKSHVVYL